MKTKTLTLCQWQDRDGALVYRVERLTDSIAYAIGHVLNKNEVADLCDLAGWKVIIKDHNT